MNRSNNNIYQISMANFETKQQLEMESLRGPKHAGNTSIKKPAYVEIVEEDYVKTMLENDELFRISSLNYFLISFTILTYAADIVSDLVLGMRYLYDSEWIYGTLTIAFVVCPSVLINAYLDYGVALWRKMKHVKLFRLWIVPYLILNLEPILYYVKNINRVREFQQLKIKQDVRRQVMVWDRFTMNYREAAWKRHWEALLESGPQFLMQLYFILRDADSLNLDLTLMLQLLALLTSLVGIFSARFTVHKAHYLEGEVKMSTLGCVLYATGYTIPIGCRAVSMAALMSVRPWWCLGWFCCHWFTVSVWWWLHGTGKRSSLMVSAIDGLSLILQPSFGTELRALLTNIIWFVEDTCLLIFWRYTVSATGTKDATSIPILCIPIICNIIFRSNFCLYRKYIDSFKTRIRNNNTAYLCGDYLN